MRIGTMFTGLVAIALAACSPQTATQTTAPTADSVVSVHPVSGLEVVPLTVISGQDRHDFRVEVARSVEQQRQGLMYREELGPNEGMIFPYKTPAMQGFWMRNTPLPLDIIFVGPDGRIINIAANTQPFSDQSVYSEGAANLVLEIPGGRAAELGIEPGDLVEW